MHMLFLEQKTGSAHMNSGNTSDIRLMPEPGDNQSKYKRAPSCYNQNISFSQIKANSWEIKVKCDIEGWKSEPRGNFSIEIKNDLINIGSERERREICISTSDTLFNGDKIEKTQ